MSIPSIDVHSHALPQAYLDALAELGVNPVEEDGFPTPAWSEDDLPPEWTVPRNAGTEGASPEDAKEKP